MSRRIAADDLLDTADLAALLGTSEARIRERMADPQRGWVPEPLRQIGQSWVWVRAEVVAEIARREREELLAFAEMVGFDRRWRDAHPDVPDGEARDAIVAGTRLILRDLAGGSTLG